VVFAVDSIRAILALTQDPASVVFTSTRSRSSACAALCRQSRGLMAMFRY